MTTPEPTPADVLARRMRLTPVDEQLRAELNDAIAAAEADVEGYLGRPIRPVTKTATRCWPVPGGWEIPTEHGTIREILGATAETIEGVETGTFTVRYTVGIDYLNDDDVRPIQRYIMAAAANDPMLLSWVAAEKGGHGAVKSVSVSTEGQSKNVTYADLGYGGGGAAGSDAPGALPSRTTLDKWRKANRRVIQAPDQGYDARLYGAGTSGVAVRDRDGFWNQQ